MCILAWIEDLRKKNISFLLNGYTSSHFQNVLCTTVLLHAEPKIYVQSIFIQYLCEYV